MQKDFRGQEAPRGEPALLFTRLCGVGQLGQTAARPDCCRPGPKRKDEGAPLSLVPPGTSMAQSLSLLPQNLLGSQCLLFPHMRRIRGWRALEMSAVRQGRCAVLRPSRWAEKCILLCLRVRDYQGICSRASRLQARRPATSQEVGEEGRLPARQAPQAVCPSGRTLYLTTGMAHYPGGVWQQMRVLPPAIQTASEGSLPANLVRRRALMAEYCSSLPEVQQHQERQATL